MVQMNSVTAKYAFQDLASRNHAMRQAQKEMPEVQVKPFQDLASGKPALAASDTFAVYGKSGAKMNAFFEGQQGSIIDSHA